VVYIGGTFDLFHAGHIEALKVAKEVVVNLHSSLQGMDTGTGIGTGIGIGTDADADADATISYIYRTHTWCLLLFIAVSCSLRYCIVQQTTKQWQSTDQLQRLSAWGLSPRGRAQ
jgi:hypothetical protein